MRLDPQTELMLGAIERLRGLGANAAAKNVLIQYARQLVKLGIPVIETVQSVVDLMRRIPVVAEDDFDALYWFDDILKDIHSAYIGEPCECPEDSPSSACTALSCRHLDWEGADHD